MFHTMFRLPACGRTFRLSAFGGPYFVICLIAGLTLLPALASAAGADPERNVSNPADLPAPSAAERAVAFGLLLDTPRPQAVIDEGLIVAEQLRRIYRIDTGNRFADYRAAAERARDEVLEPLDPSPRELATVAESLGYSLLPERCGNTCGSVERLARAEIAKRALKAFIAAAGSKH